MVQKRETGADNGAVTIRDVARLAETSTATVSRVLNGTGFVTEDLYKRVTGAAVQLGYAPNAVARSLKQRKTNTIGVLISDIANPFFGSVVRGIEDILAERQYNALLCNTDRQVSKEAHYVRLLVEKRVDGLIISAAGNSGEHLALLREHGIPWVFVNRRPPGIGGPVVQTDNLAGAYEAAAHLIALGHRRIGVVAGPQDVNTGRERLKGFTEALADRGVPLPAERIYLGDFGEESGYAGIRQLMTTPSPPTALLISNNLMTVGALRALKEMGLKVPEDVALVAFDETDWARIVVPPLTTVAQLTYEMGQASARQILKAIGANGQAGEQVVSLKPRLIVRESCGSKPEISVKRSSESDDLR